MSKAIDVLKDEHEAVLSSLEILDRIVAGISKGATPAGQDLGCFVGFLKEFADKCHHGKEEGLLFPALVDAGLPEHGGPTAAMLSEHFQGRDFVREMDLAIASGPDYVTFSYAASAYSSLLKSHIEKEDSVLFPIAEEMLEGARMNGLYKSFEEHEEKVMGRGRHEELLRILKDLQNKYVT